MRAYESKKYYSGVGLLRQKIDGAQSQQRDFLLFGTDIYLLVTNQNIFQEGALIYGAYRCRDWYIFNMDKIYVIFAHPGWVGLNT